MNNLYRRPVAVIDEAWDCPQGKSCPLKFVLPNYVARNPRQEIWPCPASRCNCAAHREDGTWRLIDLDDDED
jgi:hypothetical protein